MAPRLEAHEDHLSGRRRASAPAGPFATVSAYI